MNKFDSPISKRTEIILKIILTLAVPVVSLFYLFILLIFSLNTGITVNVVLEYIAVLIVPVFLLTLIWFNNRKKLLKIWAVVAAVFVVAVGINIGIDQYDKSITINTTPNIAVSEYLPFKDDSKIVTLEDEASLKLTENLPKIDGAAAVFPVYSAFVNAVYPKTTELWDGVFEYNNTIGGYKLLGERQTDIFFGAYPSEEQIEEAKYHGTEFVYAPIGYDAFVFFVHKDNPIDNLTTEQVQGIYSGEITNWSQIGGKNEEIAAYQRNEGSGSQSMLIRFMDGKEIMEAPTEMVDDLMVGIVELVSDYRSKSNSIGFSFRYYLEGIIKNPDIKILSIDGVAPTAENIKNGSYPITGPLYAVTWEGNDNENVEKLIDWILSEEGQEIIEKTGYVGIN
ncbi:MAG: PstS family phosphate ABC transporter substrate-binding protein [Oscillospiraceae bacterium]|nr:PstS family phosphate ABC transporter substrate-binding protein [Oscillospiraceae bacterium]